MLKKIMAAIGFGSAKIELRLPKESFFPGETFTARAIVTAGNTEQQANQLYLHLDVRSEYEADDTLKMVSDTVFTYKDGKSFVTGPANPEHVIDFSCTVPQNIPVTYGRTRYKMEAGLDIKNAINPTDQKSITIIPAPEQAAVMTAMEQLGFRHKRESGNFNGRKQWFELQPTDFMRGELDELELALSYTATDLTIYMQIDKKGKGLMGMLLDEPDLDERHTALKLSSSQLLQAGKPDIAGTMAVLKNFIEKEYEKIL